MSALLIFSQNHGQRQNHGQNDSQRQNHGQNRSQIRRRICSTIRKSLQLLSLCLILSQSAIAAHSCRVQVGAGRVFADGPLSLKILSFNLKDTFIEESAHARGDYKILTRDKKFRFKNTAMLDWQREIIREQDSDIMIGTEVHKDEDARDIMKLDTLGLRDKYYTFLKEGNSTRGINIMIAVKKDLGLKFKLNSYKDRVWIDPETKTKYPLFSRDLPTLILTRPGDDKPMLIVMGHHAKSKRDNPFDKESQRYRTAQYEGIQQVIKELKEKYGEDVPLILAGDFNTDVTVAPEMNSIRNKMRSVFDSIKGRIFESVERATHFYFGPEGRSARQLDDIRVSGRISVLFAKVLAYKKANGEEIPEPQSFAEREKVPSDHRPVVATVVIEKDK